ncbi:hypothetical protein [Helicobacter salomonis]|uniref:hypothetical protein n=1 Tax=Helicobacter salomonis TaxID=56878 RepID=UPI000CF01A2C|nr:hypothetical protein [Helicobacter salomonis]
MAILKVLTGTVVGAAALAAMAPLTGIGIGAILAGEALGATAAASAVGGAVVGATSGDKM